MPDITVVYRDGSREVFEELYRAGGSYHNSVRYEGGVAIIRDSYGNETGIPLDLISRIENPGYRH